MAVVSISRGYTSLGKEVAEKTAQLLGSRCLARDDVIRESGLALVDEAEVIRALDQPPSFLDRIVGGREHYVATARAALLSQLTEDNVVYHGFAGHFFLKDIAHVLKVRVLTALPVRIAMVAQRDRVSRAEATSRLARIEVAQRQWAMRVCGMDPEDPMLYDIVVNVGKMGTDEVSKIIGDLTRNAPFRSTPESQQELRDLALVAAVEAVLLDMEIALDSVKIEVQQGNVIVRIQEPPRTQAGSNPEFHEHYLQSVQLRLHERTRAIPGLKAVHLEQAVD